MSSDRPSGAIEMVSELHRRQGDMYAGGSVDPVAELLAQDIIWHVLGKSAIAGSYRGIGQVLGYFERRREMANATMRMHPREVIADGEAVVQLVDGSAEIGEEAVSWRTVGIYHVDEHWIREVWLVPLDEDRFDQIWSRSASLGAVDDDQVLGRIDELVREEEELLHRHEGEEELSPEENARLEELKVQLDQAWDYLRQRRALRQYGEDPDEASTRDAGTVEGYEN